MLFLKSCNCLKTNIWRSEELCVMHIINLQPLWLEIFVFLTAIVAGAGLGGAGQFAVACDAGLGIVVAQLLQQFVESVALQFGAGVRGGAVWVESSLVAHGYRTAVETAGVHTPHTLWQYRNHRAVAPHIVVIRWLAESLPTCSYQPFDCEGMVALAARAVHHQPLHIVGP